MPNDLPGPSIDSVDWQALVRLDTGPPTAARPLYTPTRVRARHRIAVMLHEAGWKSKDIAKALGYTESRISIILNSQNEELLSLRESFAATVADNAVDTGSRIKAYANEMLTVLVGHARNVQEAVNSRIAATELLHMAGFSPVKKQFQLSAEVPAEEIHSKLQEIKEANEVVMQAGQWAVRRADD